MNVKKTGLIFGVFLQSVMRMQAQMEIPKMELEKSTSSFNANTNIVEAPTKVVPTKTDMWIDEGIRLMQANQFKEASALFQQILENDPLNRRARFSLASANISMGDYQSASELLEKLIVDFPEDYSIKNNLAWMYASASDPKYKNPKKSIRLAREALLLAPSSYHVWSTLAEAHYVMGDYEKALRAAEEALRLAQSDPNGGSMTSDYLNQVNKCRRALQAMSLVE